MLDATGSLALDDCINSGSQSAELSQALSGDVTLPSMPQPGNELVLIDRSNSAIAWLDPATCTPRAQLAVGTGFPSNPHDVLALSANKAYIARYERNSNPGQQDFDAGDDLLVVDPTRPGINGRIDLAPFAAAGNDGSILPRPERLLLADGAVYVTLGATSEGFDRAAPGRVVVIDPTTDTVTGIVELAPYEGCSAMTYLADNHTLLVACGGLFAGNVAQEDGAAVVAIDVGAVPPAVKASFGKDVFGGRAVSLFTVAALSDDEIFVTTTGDPSNSPPDELWSFSLAGGPAQPMLAASGSYQFGSLLALAPSKQVILADGSSSRPLLHVLNAEPSATPKEIAAFDPEPAHGLPPRVLATY